MSEQIALTENGLAKEIANAFGYSRVAETTAEKFAAVLRYGKDCGVLKWMQMVNIFQLKRGIFFY